MNYQSTSTSSKPRLALLTLDFPPHYGGVQEYLFEIGQRLTTTYEVLVLTPVDGPLPAGTQFRRVVVPTTAPQTFWQQLRLIRPAQALLGHAHPRLLLAATLWGGRYSVIAHGNDFLAAQKQWHRPLFNWLLARARPLITNSQANARRLQQLGLPVPIVIRPGASPERFRPALKRPDDRPPTLLTISRLVSRKGVDTVLQLLPTLLGYFPHLRYYIGGHGPDRPRLETLAKSLNIAHTVKFLDNITPEELPMVYQQADIFIMPAREEQERSSTEGFGLVYLEASAAGLPVIAGRSGGAVEAVRNGETGYLVDPDDPESVVKAILTLLQNPELRRQMGQNGREWVEAEMNWHRVTKQLLQALAPK